MSRLFTVASDGSTQTAWLCCPVDVYALRERTKKDDEEQAETFVMLSLTDSLFNTSYQFGIMDYWFLSQGMKAMYEN